MKIQNVKVQEWNHGNFKVVKGSGKRMRINGKHREPGTDFTVDHRKNISCSTSLLELELTVGRSWQFFFSGRLSFLRWRLFFPLNHYFQHVSNNPTSSKKHLTLNLNINPLQKNHQLSKLLFGGVIQYQSDFVSIQVCSCGSWTITPCQTACSATALQYQHRCIWSIIACLWSFSVRLAMFPNTCDVIPALPGH